MPRGIGFQPMIQTNQRDGITSPISFGTKPFGSWPWRTALDAPNTGSNGSEAAPLLHPQSQIPNPFFLSPFSFSAFPPSLHLPPLAFSLQPSAFQLFPPFRLNHCYPDVMKLEIEIPESAFSSLRKSPDVFAQELRRAACAKWYELGKLSQAKAAEIAGLSRSAFLEVLKSLEVPAIQTSPSELEAEIAL